MKNFVKLKQIHMLRKTISLIIIFAWVLPLAGCDGWGLKRIDTTTKKYIQPITLNYWRVWDGPDSMQEIMDAYMRMHPFVKINYTKLRYEEYEQKLLEAFATDKGPDLFSIHNTWLRKYQSKGMIAAMPSKVSMATPVVTGSIKKEVEWKVSSIQMPAVHEIKNKFIDTVYDDVVIDQIDPGSGSAQKKVFALPLSVDTPVMFYNRDLFNNAGIINAPTYWNREFQQDVKKLTKQNNKGQLIQSGAALGGSDNIERYIDLVSLLMMQSGAEMMNGSQVTFNRVPSAFADKNYNPGPDALRFYMDFSNPAKEVYSWNSTNENSVDMFINNKLGMMFGYAYMLPEIKSRAPKLNFALSPMPQIEGNSTKANYANYWTEAVSSKILTNAANLAAGGDYAKQKLNTAWDFIRFATDAANVKSYLDKTGKPTALRSLIEEQAKDPEKAVFANQLLTAKSWYRGNNANAMELIFKEMIDSVATGQAQPQEAVNLAAVKVQQTVGE